MDSFPVINPKTSKVLTVGKTYALKRLYDENQLWFNFMKGEVFCAYDDDEIIFKKKLTHSSPYRNLYLNPKQAILPFRRLKCLSNKQLHILFKSNYPTFDKDVSGNIFRITVRTNETRSIIKNWCMTNLSKRFHIKNNYELSLESEVDAVLAKMRFS